MRTAAYKKPWGTPVPGVRRQSRSSAIHTLQTLADFKNRPRRQESLFDGLILQTRGGLVDHFDRTGIGRTRPPQVALAFVQLPKRDGAGWAVVVDLPASRKASTVIAKREDLASALAVDEVQLIAERIRGKGGHAGRLSLWIADNDPYAAEPLASPLGE